MKNLIHTIERFNCFVEVIENTQRVLHVYGTGCLGTHWLRCEHPFVDRELKSHQPNSLNYSPLVSESPETRGNNSNPAPRS